MAEVEAPLGTPWVGTAAPSSAQTTLKLMTLSAAPATSVNLACQAPAVALGEASALAHPKSM